MFESKTFCSSNFTLTFNCSCESLYQFTTINYGITSFENLLSLIEYIPISLIIIIFFLSSLLNFFAIGTFYQIESCKIGGGIYRRWISIIGQIGLTIFFIQIFLKKYNYEKINCYFFEYIHKSIYSLYYSLTACTSIERTILIFQGISFNKIASQRIAKLVIFLLILYHFIIIIYQPFYRQIINTFNQSLCIIKFPNILLRNYEITINLIHFIFPYFILFILPIIWIIILTKHKIKLYKNISIWNNLKKVLCNYKPSIITNYLLIIFNTPRLLTIFYLTCISQNLTYFISLIPFLTNLFIFVLPTPKYRTEFFRFIQYLMKYRYRNQYNLT